MANILPVGTRVFLRSYRSPENPGPKGTIVGHGMLHHATSAQPVVLVRLEKGSYLADDDQVFVSTLSCDPDNIVAIGS